MATFVLATAALLLLLLGTLVYVLDRPAGSAWLLPAQWQVQTTASWFGRAGEWLPSLAHGFAFSVLTALLLPRSRRWAAAACAGWAAIDTLAELGQHRAVSAWLAQQIEWLFNGSPWGARLAHYFSRGVFDTADVAAGLTGCALAYAAWHWAVLRRHAARRAR